MKPHDRIRRLFDAILQEVRENPRLAERVSNALDDGESRGRPTNRRAPGAFDPFAVLQQSGETALRERLAQLTVDQLKDIVSEHGMDSSRLALKWKTADRLIDLIADRVRNRTEKGDAFRSTQQ